MYKLPKLPEEVTEHVSIIRKLDGAFIPFDPRNIDYQEYLQWLAEGNEPEPADEPEEQP
jgi:hypothetical protein